jgi:hypothetical protein
MRINDYLLEVNEKLVEEKYPHSKEPRKVVPIKSKDNDKKRRNKSSRKDRKSNLRIRNRLKSQ